MREAIPRVRRPQAPGADARRIWAAATREADEATRAYGPVPIAAGAESLASAAREKALASSVVKHVIIEAARVASNEAVKTAGITHPASANLARRMIQLLVLTEYNKKKGAEQSIDHEKMDRLLEHRLGDKAEAFMDAFNERFSHHSSRLIHRFLPAND